MLDNTMAEGIWIGHLYLRPPGAAAAKDHDVVTVEIPEPRIDAPCLLALRFLSPLAALPAARRAELRMLLTGDCSELVAASCHALGCASVRHWEKETIEADATFHRVLFSCQGKEPRVEDFAPLVKHLRQEGQLGLFDLPAATLPQLQNELAEHGFSLRAAGTEAMAGFLAGSIENPQQFSA